MWRRIKLVIDGFLVGILFEYTLRVEVSVFPIIIAILLIIDIIIDIWLGNVNDNKVVLITEVDINKVPDNDKK